MQTSKIFTIFFDSFRFAGKIFKQDPNLYMASRDIDSLCTNIPLVENIVICIDSLYNDSENTNKILNVFGNLLNVTTKKLFFLCLTINFMNKLMVW